MSSTKIKFQNLLNHIITWLIYLLLAITPLLFSLDFYNVFTVPKLLFIRAITLLAVFIVTLKLFWLKDNKPLLWPKTWLNLALLPILVSTLLSSLFSLNIYSSWFGQYGGFMGFWTYFNCFVLTFLTAQFLTPKTVTTALKISFWTAAFVALFGLLQWQDFFGLWTVNWSDDPQKRIFSSIGHANHLGAYLAGHFLLSFWLFRKAPKLWQFLVMLTALLILIALLLTASRGAVFALFISGILLIPKAAWQKIFRRQLLVWWLLGVLIVTLTITILSNSKIGLVERTSETISAINAGYSPERWSFLNSAWQMFLDHPLLGTGLSTYRDAFSIYRPKEYRVFGVGNVEYITIPEAAHNEYANYLATTGLIGFLAYLWLIIQVFRSIKDTSHPLLAQALKGLLLVYLIQTFFSFGQIFTTSQFYLYIGMLAALKPKTTHQLALPSALKYLLSAILLWLILAGANYLVLQPALSDWYLNQAAQAEADSQDTKAEQAYQLAVKHTAGEYLLVQKLADFYLSSAAATALEENKQDFLQKAISAYQKAKQLNPNYPSTHFNSALAELSLYRLTLQDNHLAKAKNAFLEAINRAPNNPRFLYEYAKKLHSEWGDRVGAVQYLQQAIAINSDYQEPQDYLNFLYQNHPELKTAN